MCCQRVDHLNERKECGKAWRAQPLALYLGVRPFVTNVDITGSQQCIGRHGVYSFAWLDIPIHANNR